jgi:WD40 repeat protein
MGRPERALDPDAGQLQRFASDLRQLRVAAGRPSYRELSRRAHFSVTALSEAAGGSVMPSLPVTLAYVRACGGDHDAWAERWHRLAVELAPEPSAKPVDDSPAPYPGLAPFEQVDAERFFGRLDLVHRLTDRVRTGDFVALFGPSGIGKSSILRAGLVPTLRDADEGWRAIVLTPGRRPLEELAVRLGNAAGVDAGSVHQTLDRAALAQVRLTVRQVSAQREPPGSLLLVVDQFEEVFTHCVDDRQRTRFVDVLVAIAEEDTANVVLGVRADFYARCAAYPVLVRILDGHQLLVGPMSEDELREAVTGPARWAGLSVDRALVETVVADARQQPGALPMVSHALRQTWIRRTGPALTLAAYRAAGGVAGSVARTAEQVYGTCSPQQQAAMRRIFLRLTAFGDGTENTRRRARLAEFIDGGQAETMRVVLDRLTAARLVVADQDSVTVAHEALIGQWPRLAGWLAEDRDFLREHRRLTEAAEEWTRHGRDDAYLFRGARVASWADRPLDRLSDAEREFLAASRRREAQTRSRGRRRVRLTIAGLAAALAAISVLAAAALAQADRLATERDLAFSRQLSAQASSQMSLDPAVAVRLAVQAYSTSPTAEAEAVLRQSVVEQHPTTAVPEGRGRLLGVTFSADGRSVATSGEDGRIYIRPWPLGPGAPVSLVLDGARQEAWTPHFSPDGRRLAVGGDDGVVRVWDLSRPQAPARFDGKAGLVLSVDISPDGRLLASGHADGTVRLWKIATGRVVKVLRGHDGSAVGVAFSPDGRLLASSGQDRTIRLWDLTGRRAPVVLTGHQDQTKSLDFTPDGRWLASASLDGTARIWPVASQGGEAVVLRGHQGTVENVAFSPDGRRLATTSDDRTVRVWNRDGSGAPLVMSGNGGTVWAVAFSPDGSRLISVGDDGTTRVWDPRGPGAPLMLRGHQGAAWVAAFSRDGRHIVSGGADRTVRVWPADGSGTPVMLRGHQDEVLGASFSPDGQTVASASRDGTVRVWNAAGDTEPLVLQDGERFPWQATFTPDGRRLATAGRDGKLRIWTLPGRGTPLVRAADSEQIRDVAVSPDGRKAATAGWDGTVRVWDTAGTAPPIVLYGHQGLVWSVAFLPDGAHLASAGRDGTVRIWSLVHPDAPPVVDRGHQGFAWSVSASPDRRWLATAGKDGTVRIWSTDHAGQPVTYTGFDSLISTVAFAPDSRKLVTAHEDGTVRVWDCLACRPANEVVHIAADILARG